ncbi:hypothetical protein Vadar_018544 [Vaccinium darrowii]|uniref:Uncharacterized protein n=1 Tax=Vaccinium darrowii TaxID=229202 RepID=A0ACB7XAQ8_9ERIC|nr:hypothetical protein Vadar_018544 [Vaccinium darrowii]
MEVSPATSMADLGSKAMDSDVVRKKRNGPSPPELNISNSEANGYQVRRIHRPAGIRKLGLPSIQSRRRKVMGIKALGTSLKLSLEGNNQLIYPETWFFYDCCGYMCCHRDVLSQQGKYRSRKEERKKEKGKHLTEDNK